MTFIITDTQRLISEAGGYAPPGMKLKVYFWQLCNDLLQYANHYTQPRSIEKAWREDHLSLKLRAALERLAQKRKHDADHQLVKDFERMVEEIEASPLSDEFQYTAAAQISSNLAAIKQCVAQRYRNMAMARCYALIETAEREAEDEDSL